MLTVAIGLVLFPALMAYAAASDLITMTISNRVSLALVVGFFVIALVIGMAPRQIGMHVLAGLLVLCITFACFALGWIGGGDAKLAAATALWFGFDQMLDYLLLASIFGGALTLGLLQFRKYPLPGSWQYPEWVTRLHHHKTGVPYGIALAAAALLIYPYTDIMRAQWQ
ncbi:A24 family peptidase [Variibacter gotjawalensis]|nr:prepilin peptidase [Variibacter gotjawalensis]